MAVLKTLAIWLLLAASIPAEERQVQVWVYSADWCKPCRTMKEESAELVKKGYEIADDDEGDKKAADFIYTFKHPLRTFPTIIVYRDGKEVFRKQGYMSVKDLASEYWLVK